MRIRAGLTLYETSSAFCDVIMMEFVRTVIVITVK